MPVKSLAELATSVCLKNIKELQSVGDYLPYQTVRHILVKVESAYQLRQIEINSPQIEGETGELWLRIIERDFPLEYKNTAYKPQHPSKWYRVWEKYKKDHDVALEESERKLKLSLAGLQEDKEKNTSRIVDRRDKKYLPREPGAKRHWSQRQLPSNLTFGGGKRTSTSTGAGVMRKVRREVKELASIHGVFSKTGRRPIHHGQVTAAPPAMVNDYRRAAQPAFRSNPKQAVPSSAVTEHEQRAAFISDSDEDGDDGDELFDGSQRPAKRKPFAKPFKPNFTADAIGASSSSKKPAGAGSSVANVTGSPARLNVGRPSATTTASSSKRGSGLLSNSYKPPAARNTVTRVVSKSTPESKSKAGLAGEPPFHNKPTQQQLQQPRRQASPPPPSFPAASASSSASASASASGTRASSPPAAAPSGAEGPPRKRKAVDIFMRPRKRP